MKTRIKRQSKVNLVNNSIQEVESLDDPKIRPYKLDTLAKITIINRRQSRCETIARLAVSVINRAMSETKKSKQQAV